MIKEALQYIVGLSKPATLKIDSRIYSTAHLSPVLERWPDPLKLSSLPALVDYIAKDADNLECKLIEPGLCIIAHVSSPTRVCLYLPIRGEHNQRVCLAVAEPELPHIDFDRYMPGEAMVVMLQSKFASVAGDDLTKVLAVAGNVSDGVAREYSDDGMSQQVTVRAGVASKANIVVPNPVLLAPFRTFHDVQQPLVPFVLRAQGGKADQPPAFALFEADGGAWRNTAMEAIKDWLRGALNDHPSDVTIL